MKFSTISLPFFYFCVNFFIIFLISTIVSYPQLYGVQPVTTSQMLAQNGIQRIEILSQRTTLYYMVYVKAEIFLTLFLLEEKPA